MKIEEGDKYYLRNVTWVGNTIYASDWLNAVSYTHLRTSKQLQIHQHLVIS